MDTKEIAQHLLGFINESGYWSDFLDYMDEKGYDIDSLESEIDDALEDEY